MEYWSIQSLVLSNNSMIRFIYFISIKRNWDRYNLFRFTEFLFPRRCEGVSYLYFNGINKSRASKINVINCLVKVHSRISSFRHEPAFLLSSGRFFISARKSYTPNACRMTHEDSWRLMNEWMNEWMNDEWMM